MEYQMLGQIIDVDDYLLINITNFKFQQIADRHRTNIKFVNIIINIGKIKNQN